MARRTGGTAPYGSSDGSYMLHQTQQATQGAATPSMKSGGGSCASCNTVSGGGSKKSSRRGGAPVELTAFISALALLGARLLADKNSSFNLYSSEQPQQPRTVYEEQVGGRRRRVGRPAAKKPAAKRVVRK